jgi:hypothetical protein
MSIFPPVEMLEAFNVVKYPVFILDDDVPNVSEVLQNAQAFDVILHNAEGLTGLPPPVTEAYVIDPNIKNIPIKNIDKILFNVFMLRN